MSELNAIEFMIKEVKEILGDEGADMLFRGIMLHSCVTMTPADAAILFPNMQVITVFAELRHQLLLQSEKKVH